MYIYNARVLKVVDGDTVDLEVDLGFHITAKHRFRLARIDTAEKNSSIPEERMLADIATKFLVEKFNAVNNQIVIKTTKQDKYGRYLVDIIVNDQNINDEMLALGLAVKYGEK